MIHGNMVLHRFLVNAQQVEESRLRNKNREDKKAKSFEGSCSKI